MITKSALEKILRGILHRDEEERKSQTHELKKELIS
jgi:hypothetical protein